MIIKFNKFINEVRIEDSFKNTNDDNYLNSYKNKKFINDAKLIDRVVLSEKFDYKILTIKWNHNKYHNMIDRIKNRTSFKSMCEFNEFFEQCINNLFDEHFDEIKKEFNKYNIYTKNEKLSLIVDINLNDIFKQNTIIEIITIINGLTNDVDEIIEI